MAMTPKIRTYVTSDGQTVYYSDDNLSAFQDSIASSGTSINGTNGTTGTGVPQTAAIRGSGEPPTDFPCETYTYSLQNFQFVKTGTPNFNGSLTQNQDYTNLKSNECVLIAQVIECCWSRLRPGSPLFVNRSEAVGWVVIARTKPLVTYESCITIDGKPGKRPVIVQYIDLNDIIQNFTLSGILSPLNLGAKNIPYKPAGKRDFDAIWGVCDIYSPTDFGTYINSNLYSLIGKNNLSELDISRQTLDSARYPLIDPFTSGITQAYGLLADPYDTNGCSDRGDCIALETPPPPPPPPPPYGGGKEEKICIQVLDFEDATRMDWGQRASEISGRGSYVIPSGFFRGLTIPAQTHFYSSIVYPIAITSPQSALNLSYGFIQYGTYSNNNWITTKFDGEQRNDSDYDALFRLMNASKIYDYSSPPEVVEKTGRVPLNRTNLIGEDGLPLPVFECRTGGYIQKRKTRTPIYQQYEICYTVKEYNPDRASADPIQIVLAKQPEIRVIGQFTGPKEEEMLYWEFDPEFAQSFEDSCCNDAQLFRAYPYDQPDNMVASLPPPNLISRLEHDLSMEEWVLLDECSCEEVWIADVWCIYNNERVKKIHEKNINNTLTHVRKRKVIDARCGGETGVYNPFDRKNDIIQGRRKHITKGLFNLNENLLCYLTSSTQQTASMEYYYDVTDCDNCGRDPYFAVAYGHINGSGSLKVDEELFTKTPTDSIYSQYQLLCSDSATFSTSSGFSLPKFSFISSSTQYDSDDVYVINFYRKGLSDKIDPGNFQINLAHLSGSSLANNIHTGSNVRVSSSAVLNLIDDSGEYSAGLVCDGGEFISYNIVSGTLDGGIYQPASINTYGKLYPQLGVIVLDPKRLNEILGFNTVTGSNIDGDNAYKLFTSISGAAAPTSGRQTVDYMTGRNITYKSTTHYLVRVFPNRSNYSNNPTFVSGSKNDVFDTCFIEDPNTYITSVGLYNSYKELIAIAKLSRPVKKNFDTDLVIKIRLNW
jgi:hypothetical protein